MINPYRHLEHGFREDNKKGKYYYWPIFGIFRIFYNQKKFSKNFARALGKAARALRPARALGQAQALGQAARALGQAQGVICL